MRDSLQKRSAGVRFDKGWLLTGLSLNDTISFVTAHILYFGLSLVSEQRCVLTGLRSDPKIVNY